MRPPCCAVCDEAFDPADGGRVAFADRSAVDRPGPEPGVAWFCGQHLAAAHAFAHLRLAEALRAIRSEARS